MTDIIQTQYLLEQSQVEGVIDILRSLRLPREEVAKIKTFLDAVDYQDQASGYERVINKDGSTELREQKELAKC